LTTGLAGGVGGAAATGARRALLAADAVALPALRHRVLLNFEGEAEGMKTDEVIDAIVKGLPETKAGKAEAQVGAS
jgi:MoxR-like ATPase